MAHTRRQFLGGAGATACGSWGVGSSRQTRPADFSRRDFAQRKLRTYLVGFYLDLSQLVPCWRPLTDAALDVCATFGDNAIGSVDIFVRLPQGESKVRGLKRIALRRAWAEVQERWKRLNYD